MTIERAIEIADQWVKECNDILRIKVKKCGIAFPVYTHEGMACIGFYSTFWGTYYPVMERQFYHESSDSDLISQLKKVTEVLLER